MKNVFAFHGADHKCGTSMIAQCVSERLAAELPKKNVLLIHTEGREGTEYSGAVSENMERIKPYLADKLVDADEVMSKAKWRSNLFIIGGASSISSSLGYHPDMANYLLSCLSRRFDIILCDTGSELQHGLALGSLFAAQGIYFLLSQAETAIKRYEYMTPIYGKLRLDISGYVLNRFEHSGIYSEKYVADRLSLDRDTVYTVRDSKHGKRAEMDGRSILNYRDAGFKKDVDVIVWAIARAAHCCD